MNLKNSYIDLDSLEKLSDRAYGVVTKFISQITEDNFDPDFELYSDLESDNENDDEENEIDKFIKKINNSNTNDDELQEESDLDIEDEEIEYSDREIIAFNTLKHYGIIKEETEKNYKDE